MRAIRLRLEPGERGTLDHAMSDSTDHVADHIVPRRTYVLIYLALLVCTLLTWQVAYFDLGPMNAVAALTIAVFKAVLVVLFFMHVKYSTRLTWLVVMGSVLWLGILLALTMTDYLTRVWRTYG
jgi:cytochrome c oxidase subunit 4